MHALPPEPSAACRFTCRKEVAEKMMRDRKLPIRTLAKATVVLFLAAPMARAQQICGDCDDSESISIVDSLVAARIAVALTSPVCLQFQRCDVNSDGMITVIDALLIAQVAAGLPTPLSCPSLGWVERMPAQSPDARFEHTMEFFPPMGEVVLFGGASTMATYNNDLWSWDGTTWTPCSSAQAPEARFDHAMSYDPALQQLVVFGGHIDPLGECLADTWTGDACLWSQRAASGPDGRNDDVLQLDSTHGNCLLFGQSRLCSPGGGTDETWLLSAGIWTQASPMTVPSTRYAHRMADCPMNGGVLMFGGMLSATGVSTDETWTWDGADWHAQSPTTSPPPRNNHAMVFLEGCNRILLFGGDDGMGSVLGDTWLWNGSTWVDLTPALASSPPARRQHMMAYDPIRRQVVLFGGWDGASHLGDTWVLQL